MEFGEVPLAPEAACVGLDIRVVGNDSGEKVSLSVLARALLLGGAVGEGICVGFRVTLLIGYREGEGLGVCGWLMWPAGRHARHKILAQAVLEAPNS